MVARPSWLRRNRWWLIALGILIASHTISTLVGVIGAPSQPVSGVVPASLRPERRRVDAGGGQLLDGLGGILTTITSNFVGFRSRMAWVVFPLSFAYACFLRRWWAMVSAVGVCVAGLAFFSYGVSSFVP